MLILEKLFCCCKYFCKLGYRVLGNTNDPSEEPVCVLMCVHSNLQSETSYHQVEILLFIYFKKSKKIQNCLHFPVSAIIIFESFCFVEQNSFCFPTSSPSSHAEVQKCILITPR